MLAHGGDSGTQICRRQTLSGPVPIPGGRYSLAKQLALLLSVRVPVFPHGGGVRTACSLGEKSADGTGLFMFHSMFVNGTVRRADLWFLEYSVFTRTRCFEHVYRCSPPMQPHHAK